MEIEKELYGRIREYCALNGLKIGKYVNSLLKDAFIRDVYGELTDVPAAAGPEEAGPAEQEPAVVVPAAEIAEEPAPAEPEAHIQEEKPIKRRRLS